jgi:hypothetical protein
MGIGELVQIECLYGCLISGWGRENELELLNRIKKNYPIGEIVFVKGESATSCISEYDKLNTIIKAFKGDEVFFDLHKNEFNITTSPFQELEFWQIPFAKLFCGRSFYKFQTALLDKDCEDTDLLLERYEAIGNQLGRFQISVVEIHDASESELVELTRILN